MNWDNNIMDRASSLTATTQCILHGKRFTLVVLVQPEGAVGTTTANVWNPQMLHEKNQPGHQTVKHWFASEIKTKPSEQNERAVGVWDRQGLCSTSQGAECVPESCLLLDVLMTNRPMRSNCNSDTLESTGPKGAGWSWPWMHGSEHEGTMPVCLGRGCWDQQRALELQAPEWRPQTQIPLSQVRLSWQEVLWDLSAQPFNYPEPSPRAWRVPRAMAMNVSSTLSSHGSHRLSH